MVEVTWQLGRASLADAVTIPLAVASLIALLRFRVNSAWLVLVGAAIGLIANALHLR
jgi:chromate transporter